MTSTSSRIDLSSVFSHFFSYSRLIKILPISLNHNMNMNQYLYFLQLHPQLPEWHGKSPGDSIGPKLSIGLVGHHWKSLTHDHRLFFPNWLPFTIWYKIWLVVWNMNLIFPDIGNFIIPTDFHISQRGRYTTNQKMVPPVRSHSLVPYIYHK